MTERTETSDLACLVRSALDTDNPSRKVRDGLSEAADRLEELSTEVTRLKGLYAVTLAKLRSLEH